MKSTDRGSVCANDLHTHTYSLPFAINGSDYSAPDTQATSSLVSVYSSVAEKEWISNTTTCDKPLCDLGMLDENMFLVDTCLLCTFWSNRHLHVSDQR